MTVGNEKPRDEEAKGGRGAAELIEAGADVVGNVSGAAIGFVLAGPPGSLAGAAAAPVAAHALRRAATEIRRRFLSPREQARIGGALGYAAERIALALESGATIRDDGFFDAEVGNRPAAEEVVEGVLLAAQREHEEKKIKHYGILLASIAFQPQLDRDAANFYLRLGERFSYRQLCLLALIEGRQEQSLPLDPPARSDIAVDLFELYQHHALRTEGDGFWLSVGQVIPGRSILTAMGGNLHALMGLDEIPRDDLLRILPLLEPARRDDKTQTSPAVE